MRENLCIQSFCLRKPSLLTVLLPFMTRCWLGHLKDIPFISWTIPEPYGWTVAAKVPQDQVLNMGSTVRYTAVFLGAVFLALLCLYCHNYISLHLYKDAV